MRLGRVFFILVLIIAILIMSLACVAKSPPVAQISVSSTTVRVDESISFSGADSIDIDGDITFYEWDFGDGSTASSAIVSHAYSVAGTYNIKLTVIDNDGLKDTAVVTIICVEPELGPATYHVATAGDDAAGDGSEDNPWATISHAISQAASGDTIIVHSGTYTENVDVNKSTTIQSMSGALVTTVEAGNPDDHVFEITASGVTINGFTVSGARNGAGIYVKHSSNNAIEQNVCKNNGTGIAITDESSETIIRSNICSENTYNGISVNRSSNNTVENNTSSKNGTGIIIAENSESNVVQDNNCFENDYSGIGIWDSSWNTILNNTSSDNGSGVVLNNSNNNSIRGNECSRNDNPGIHSTESCDNLIQDNILSENSSGLALYQYSDGNNIEGNTFSDNRNKAIHIHDSNNNIIRNNTCSGGLPCINISLHGTSSGNIIESNTGCVIHQE